MAKITIEKRYGTVSNSLLNNSEVTFKAKGIFAYIQSKPDDWDFSAERIAGQTKEGLGAVKSGLRELERSGHLIRRRVNNNKGFFEVEYILIAEPDLEPMVKNPPVDKPTVDNHTNNSKKVNSKKEISNSIPAEEKVEVVSLLTSDTTVYGKNLPTIDGNCTISRNGMIKEVLPILEPKKKKSTYQSNPEKYIWINNKFKEWNDNSPKDIQILKPSKFQPNGNYYVLGIVYEKFGEEKATQFFNYILTKGNFRNPFSLISPKNHEEFENFYQDPESEQPIYLDTPKGKSTERFKNCETEPVSGDFLQDDTFYAAMENYWSQGLNGTELVKKVRSRIQEMNCKYKNY